MKHNHLLLSDFFKSPAWHYFACEATKMRCLRTKPSRGVFWEKFREISSKMLIMMVIFQSELWIMTTMTITWNTPVQNATSWFQQIFVAVSTGEHYPTAGTLYLHANNVMYDDIRDCPLMHKPHVWSKYYVSVFSSGRVLWKGTRPKPPMFLLSAMGLYDFPIIPTLESSLAGIGKL